MAIVPKTFNTLALVFWDSGDFLSIKAGLIRPIKSAKKEIENRIKAMFSMMDGDNAPINETIPTPP